MIVGLGIDIVEIERIDSLLKRQKGLVDRLLTEREKALFSGKSNGRKAEWIAGRFAAKEAAAKALGTGIGARLSFQDIEILSTEAGKPELRIAPDALAGIFPKQSPGLRFHISISHSQAYAVAQVIVEEA
ncbi:holo-ACP synthase [Brevibacillus sp. H7]|jgi:holo-[acyl-carrier protein] synthase|uniref:holo-ACP synthase n=1 Tax=Brevibacillus sp. H7 TaxID=3349138 RepID=UPI0038104208